MPGRSPGVRSRASAREELGRARTLRTRASAAAALAHCLEGRPLATRAVARSMVAQGCVVMNHRIALGVNIDHVATVRQARRAPYPDPVHAALLAEQAGADSITLHLREDRRHIQDQDVATLRPLLKTHMNLEMAVTEEMIAIALKAQPADCASCPSGARKSPPRAGWMRPGRSRALRTRWRACAAAGIELAVHRPGPAAGRGGRGRARPGDRVAHRCRTPTRQVPQQAELARLVACARRAVALGLVVHAGHGLNYQNVQPVAAIPEIVELNIGHALIGHALFVGLAAAVREMKALMRARRALDLRDRGGRAGGAAHHAYAGALRRALRRSPADAGGGRAA